MSFWVLSQLQCLSFVTFLVFNFFLHYLSFEICHIKSCWVVSQFDYIFVTIGFFEFFHNLCFGVVSQFDFLSLGQLDFLCLVNIQVFEFCHNLGFWSLSQLKFLSFVTFWFFDFCSNFISRIVPYFEFC